MVTNTNANLWRCAEATQPDNVYADPNFNGHQLWNGPSQVPGLTAFLNLNPSATVDQNLVDLENQKGAQWIWYCVF